MSPTLSNLLTEWTNATAEAKWGVQRVFHDVFSAASEGETTLIYGADYRDGKPYLVNTVGTMLTTGGGHGVPSANFGTIVSLFDRINHEMERVGVNVVPGYVSPLAADVFLRNFAPLKDKPVETAANEAVDTEAFAEGVYREPTDEDMAREIARMFMTEAHCEINLEVSDSPVETNVES